MAAGKQPGWSSDSAFSVGAAFVTALTDSLWYIDGHIHRNFGDFKGIINQKKINTVNVLLRT